MILFVDDEPEYVENVIYEMKALGLEVKFCSTVDEALEALTVFEANIKAIVLDVMIPHGDSFTAIETDDNLTTGLRLLERIRAMGVGAPVVLLTNLESGRAPVDELADKYPPCQVIRKREKWCFEIAESVRDLVTK
jgi:DNA-binding response OmpR family regulator